MGAQSESLVFEGEGSKEEKKLNGGQEVYERLQERSRRKEMITGEARAARKKERDGWSA